MHTRKRKARPGGSVDGFARLACCTEPTNNPIRGIAGIESEGEGASVGAHYLRDLSCVKHNLRPFVIMVHFGQPALKIVVGTYNDTERGVRGSLKDARSVHIKDGVHRNPDQTRHDLTKINAFDLLVELGQLLLIVSARKEGGTQTYTEPRQPFARSALRRAWGPV
jgi:hypothetical protein